jgi:transposase
MMFEAMVFILRTGIPWRDLPARYRPWNSVYTRWRRWCQRGLWPRLLAVLARNAQGRLRFLDASHVKVHQDASNPAGGQQNQAMGRTKGGLNTKVNAWVDGHGRAVSLSLAPGQHADVCAAQTAARPPLRGTITVADKGYDSDVFRAQLRRWGSRPCIPPRCNRLQPVTWHSGFYRKRHKVENLFQRLKRYRRIGTRYEKRDLYFLSFVQLAAILDWLKNPF